TPPLPSQDPSGSSTSPGSVSRLVGAPGADVTRKSRTCKAAAPLAWVPTLAAPRTLAVYFNQTPAAKVGQVGAVALYVLNKGSLDPAITAIDLLLQTASTQQQQWATMYTGGQGQRPQLTCPGLNHFPLSAAALAAVQPQLTSAEVLAAEVVGVRLHVNEDHLTNKADLPHLAAVGLKLLQT
ncbi:hypothetical protein Agub_g3943, partial [Astrephomene gubernaculifera]